MLRTLAVILCAFGLVTGRSTNGAGIALIKQYEGFRAYFYGDPVGIRTIGYGHACHAHDCTNIHPPLSESQATSLLMSDLRGFENCVSTMSGSIDDNKFSALVSFAFNLGCGALRGSTLIKYVQQHNYRSAANEFGQWVHAGGRVLPGLVKRRAAERSLFCSSGGC